MTEHTPTVKVQGGLSKHRLTERQRAILKLIVREYVSDGRPVSSKTLTERYPVGVSSATIRNEMAELEHHGYIEQLHTSGGRVPTAEGYRFFVRFLMGEVELPSVERIMISHQFRQAETQFDAWMELAASVLAETAGNVSVVTAPRTRVPRLRHFELISLQPRLALLIVVTGESLVRQSMVHLPEAADQDVLSRLADTLVVVLRGRSADELIEGLDGGVSPLAQLIVEHIAITLRGLDGVERTDVHHSGLENIVGQPDFGGDEVQSVLTLLRGGTFLSAVLPRLAGQEAVQVFIADEALPDELRRCGIVIATYGVAGTASGLLGVLGPTRMSYWRTISTVRYMANLMSDLMTDLYSVSMDDA